MSNELQTQLSGESDGNCFDKNQINNSYQHSLFLKFCDLENLLESYYKCRKGVSWKKSVQKFEHHLIDNLLKIRKEILEKDHIFKGFYSFYLKERGKLRWIRSMDIKERVIQKSLCDNILEPLLLPSLIYDSGASIKDKGTSFTRKRLIKHILKYYETYQTNEGYIILLDYKKYFDSIDHNILKQLIRKKIYDEDILNLADFYIDIFGKKGLGLGNETAELFAVFYTFEIDHFIKEKLNCKFYGRYMDDSYIIVRTKEDANFILNEIKLFLKDYSLILNERKTQIRKLNKPFTFLKCKYTINENCLIYREPVKSTIKRARLKIYKLNKLGVDKKDIDIVLNSYREMFKQLHCNNKI